MEKIIGILIVVFGLWAGVEVYNEGSDQAFGGILTTLGLAEEAPESEEPRSVGERAGTKVSHSHADANTRRERLLTE